MRLSIIIPVYNERTTLEEIVQRVRAVDLTVNRDGVNPLLDGPIPVPEGAVCSRPEDVSPNDVWTYSERREGMG